MLSNPLQCKTMRQGNLRLELSVVIARYQSVFLGYFGGGISDPTQIPKVSFEFQRRCWGNDAAQS